MLPKNWLFAGGFFGASLKLEKRWLPLEKNILVGMNGQVFLNMCSHTGGGLTMGIGFPIVSSTKQKLNTRSSTENELVSVDNMMPIIIWSCYFLMAQEYDVIQNLLLQDNKSSILLEKNGKASRSKHT
jgi:hypothetical protein